MPKDFKAKFVQRVVSPEKTELKYEGRVYFKEPNFLKWEYVTPINKSVYISFDRVIVYEPELEQALIKELSSELSLKNLVERAVKGGDGRYKSVFEKKEYFIEFKDGILSRISFIDELQNSVTIDFLEGDVKTELDKSLFIFEPEEGVDIIEQ